VQARWLTVNDRRLNYSGLHTVAHTFKPLRMFTDPKKLQRFGQTSGNPLPQSYTLVTCANYLRSRQDRPNVRFSSIMLASPACIYWLCRARHFQWRRGTRSRKPELKETRSELVESVTIEDFVWAQELRNQTHLTSLRK